MSSYTDDLLSELKETVAADVAAEEARLQAELDARAAAEEEAARQAEAARRAEIDARLEAERHRRRLADASRRAVAVGQTAAEQAEPVIPHTPATVERLAPLDGPPPAAPKQHGAGFYFVVMGLPMLCITAIVVAWIMTSPQPDLNPQPRAVAGDVATPPPPVLEVAGPGEGAEVPDNQPVSAQVGAEAPDGEDAVAAEADAASKDGKAGEKAMGKAGKGKSSKGEKKSVTRKGTKNTKKQTRKTSRGASKPEKSKPKNGLSGTLFENEDVSGFMDDK